jgi:heme/copper-type cytochrome/quinol oxidase subunit 1
MAYDIDANTMTRVLRISRKPMFAYKGMIAATVAIAGLSMTV